MCLNLDDLRAEITLSGIKSERAETHADFGPCLYEILDV